jgi:hypothetical protein
MTRTALLLITLIAATGVSAGEIVVPAIYRGPGAVGTLWRTEVVLSNVSTILTPPIQATVTFHREGLEPMSFDTPLSSGETLAIPDAVSSWFGLEQGGGLLRVTWSGPGRLAARARIYTVGDQGEYGQNVPGLPLESLQTENILNGVSGVDGNRTNIGVSNPHTEDVLVWIALYDTAGSARGAFTYAVPARSYRQLDQIFQYFQAGQLNAATIRVSSMSLPVYAYASIVRADTGDATFVVPQ